ncbi:MAG: hypothetical protein DHS20C01_35270 [marine bacterium B5-7]|nr:MAG: hypothetical protein DHS20C01_35270 [marine bacterium B5-7]
MNRKAPVRQPRYVLCCFEAYGYGGAATAVYSLFRMLQGDGLDIHLISIVSNRDLQPFHEYFGSDMANPGRLDNVHICHIGDNAWSQHESLSLLLDEIQADVMIGYGTIAAYALGSLDRDASLIYCTVGFDQLGEYLERSTIHDLCEFRSVLQMSPAALPILHRQEEDAFKNADLVITHSDYVLEFSYGFYPDCAAKIISTPIWYYDWIVADVRKYPIQKTAFDERLYDIVFVASNWAREEKNYPLVKQICACCPDLRIQIIGLYPEAIDDVEHYGFVGDRRTLFTMMGDSRVLVCPSSYDSAPGILWEAVEMGCNVVASRNCGNWMLCHPELLTESMHVDSFKSAIEKAVGREYESDTHWFDNKRSYERIKTAISDIGNSKTIFGPLSAPSTGIAYHLWHYPILSETFIQREIAAIRRRGIPLTIVAESRDETSEECDPYIKDASNVIYLDEAQAQQNVRKFIGIFFRRPFKTAFLYLYTRFSRYHSNTDLRFDKETFHLSLRLAAVLCARRIVHVHSPWSDRNAFIAKLASRMVGTSYSAQARAHDIHRRSYAAGLKATVRGAKFVITNTDYNFALLKKQLPWLARHRLRRFYNGLDLGRFVRNVAASDNTMARLLSVGRITPQKGFVDLLRACAILREHGCAFKLDIVGAPEWGRCADYYSEVTELWSNFGLEDYVEFHGAQPLSQVIRFYQSADIFVLPCVLDADGSRDIIPNALIEAMAMELPVVSTSLTGIPEIVDHDINGLLVSPGAPQELAEALLSLVGNPERRNLLGKNARIKVEQRFDIDENARSYMYLFQCLANDGKQVKNLAAKPAQIV